MTNTLAPRKTQAKTKMNVLYTSQKLQELFCDEKLPIFAHASGDGDGILGRCCRLCGGDTSLRYFGDTCIWEGVEERYDQLLYECFGVTVSSSDCMICEWCVRALRSTERFRALVHAAFDNTHSDQSSSVATLKIGQNTKQSEQPPLKQGKEPQLKKPTAIPKPKDVRKRLTTNEAKVKRINIPCEVCRQRYPMLVPSDGYKKFICSRCKKNGELKGSFCRKCNIVMPSNMMKDHLELHAKATVRAKTRPRLPKKSQINVVNSVMQHRQKFQCSRCPKKYAIAKNLLIHIKNAHGDTVENMCNVCCQEFQTREELEEHVAIHSCHENLYQCDECLLIFKNKKSLMFHSNSQHKS